MMELARQYGGYGGLYGGGYGGYVECCEGVVDPILLLGVIVGNYCTLIVLYFSITFVVFSSLHLAFRVMTVDMSSIY